MEYAYLIGIVAVGIIATIVYISRGFQGNVRSLSDQIGAGQFDSQNTNVNNVETKHLESTITSKSGSKVIYGSEDGSIPNSSTSTSSNKEDTTVVTTRNTNESLGTFANDTWN